MYQKAISNVKHSIFPIFQLKVVGNQHTISVAGTGFFINNNGYFLTANHVIKSNPDKAFKPVYLGNLPYNIIEKPIDIIETYSDEKRDIFLGKVTKNFLPSLKISYDKQLEGKSAVLSGYPLPVIGINPTGGFDLGNVRQYWQPTTIIDQFDAFNIKTPTQMITYNAYLTQHASLNGMSGGPLFDLDGNAIGMSVATTNRKVSQNDGEMRVDNGVAIKITAIKDIIEKAK